MRKTMACVLICMLSLTICNVSNCQINEYSRLVSQAESSILRSDQDSARIYYKLAFALEQDPFAVDIHNAILVNAAADDLITTTALAKVLFKKGVPLKYFDQQCFSTIRQNKRLYTDLKTIFNTLQQSKSFLVFLSRRDSVKKIIDQLIEADQALYCRRPEQINNQAFLDSSIRQVKLADGMLAGMLTRGDLSETVLGANMMDDTTISITPCYFVLFRHAFQERDGALARILEREQPKGIMPNEIYASLLESIYRGRNTAELNVIEYRCKLYELKMLDRMDQRIDPARRELGLSNMKELRQKIVLTYSVGSPYVFSGFLSKINDFADPESEKRFLESLLELKTIPKGCRH